MCQVLTIILLLCQNIIIWTFMYVYDGIMNMYVLIVAAGWTLL